MAPTSTTDTSTPRQRIETCDVVVVGSGFGGSVAAHRLAEGGRSVVLLERGQPYPPGSFARNPYEMSRAFWEPKDGLYGLFDVRSFRHLEAVVASGLGGGSLVYANVLLRKDERWFVHDSPLPGGGYEHWPVGRADLDPHYDAVERMLTPVPSPYPDLPKAQALRDAASRAGLEAMSPPLAVTFAPPGGEAAPKQVIPEPDYGNIHGRTRLTCRLCGECDIGCNEGSKNTLDHTYLSAAAHHGADIRTLADVTSIVALDGGGYEVVWTQYGDDPDAEGRRSATVRRIRCTDLVLGAGSLGTTALLLRNRVTLPALGQALGTRFSGNGDLLTFAIGARRDPPGAAPRLIDASHGPVITTAIRVPDDADDGNGGRGYYVQEAGFPEFANWLIETSRVTSSVTRAAAVAREVLRHRLGSRYESTISAEVARLVGEGRLGSSALPLLGMGRDVPDGRVTLRDGQLDVDWTTATSMAFFSDMRRTMRAISDGLLATYHDNPLWWTKRIVTVHPLGGAPMGRHVSEGVVDEYGEAFGHPGLHVLDGAAMPGPVGPNPSLTIAALADRAADHILEQPKRRRPRSTAAAAVPPPPEPPPPGRSVEFTERMRGWLALGETDPEVGAERARQLGHRFMFELTISVPDVERFVAEEDHPGQAVGYVRSELLGGRLPVERGWFNLFAPAEGPGGDAAGSDDLRREMRYRLWVRDVSGAPVTVCGVKDVHDDPELDLWRDTSTLATTLLRGHVPDGEDGEVIGAGVLRILPLDFARQLTTFRAGGDGKVASLARFGAFFGSSLRDLYLSPAPPKEVVRDQ
jgi:cholesterol oxidase